MLLTLVLCHLCQHFCTYSSREREMLVYSHAHCKRSSTIDICHCAPCPPIDDASQICCGFTLHQHLTTPIPNLGPVLSMRMPVREVTFNVHLLRTSARSNTPGDCHYILLSRSNALSGSYKSYRGLGLASRELLTPCL